MKITIAALKFVYKFSGAQWLKSEIDSFVFRYQLRVRMVPVSYKLFILSIGILIGSSSVFVYSEVPKLFEPQVMTFQNVSTIQRVEAKEIEATEVEKEKSSDWTETEVTAYTASVNETDASPLIMASGKIVYLGAVACPRSIDLGKKIEIKGLGVYTCEDRMNIRYTNNFDIFMLTKAEALKFGRQKMEYKIIK